MHKILLTDPFIGTYSVCLLAGLFGGYLLTRRQAVRSGIKGSHVDNLALLIAVFSLFGARLFSWLFYFPPGTNLWRALWDPAGGMVFYGGMIFGTLTLLVYARAAKLELGNLLDTFAPGLASALPSDASVVLWRDAAGATFASIRNNYPKPLTLT